MTPDSFSWIASFLGPVSALLISAIFFYGALYSRFRTAFAIIASAGIFFLASHAFWLVFKLQQSFGVALLSKEAYRALFPIQASSLYIGFLLVFIGDVMLVWQVSRAMPRETSNHAMERTADRSATNV